MDVRTLEEIILIGSSESCIGLYEKSPSAKAPDRVPKKLESRRFKTIGLVKCDLTEESFFTFCMLMTAFCRYSMETEYVSLV